MAAEPKDIRPKITMARTVCKERNYVTKKDHRNTPDCLEFNKYRPRRKKSASHKEIR